MATRLTRGRANAPSLALAFAMLVAGCGVGASNGSVATFPPESFGPSGATTTGAVLGTRAAVANALGAKSLQLGDPKVPFRPPEAPRFAAAPRAVYQVLLPSDPAHGFISVYEFADAAAAATAAAEQADYVGSGVGRVQFPPDSRFVIRQLGTTDIFYSWSPDNALDARTPDVQAALETIGTAVPIPR